MRYPSKTTVFLTTLVGRTTAAEAVSSFYGPDVMDNYKHIFGREDGDRDEEGKADGKANNMSDENDDFWSRLLQEAVASSAGSASLLRTNKGQGGIAKAPKAQQAPKGGVGEVTKRPTRP